MHSDLNPKNWLVDPDTLEIAALLDWEFAHAGHPFTDLGNALRFERDDVLDRGRARGYADRRGTPPSEALPSPAPPTCGRWSTSPAVAGRTRSPTGRTTCCWDRALSDAGWA